MDKRTQRYLCEDCIPVPTYYSTVPTFPGGMELYILPVFCIQKRIRMGIRIDLVVPDPEPDP
jgi:hypothetical protein